MDKSYNKLAEEYEYSKKKFIEADASILRGIGLGILILKNYKQISIDIILLCFSFNIDINYER